MLLARGGGAEASSFGESGSASIFKPVIEENQTFKNHGRLVTLAIGTLLLLPFLVGALILSGRREEQRQLHKTLLLSLNKMGDFACFYCNEAGKPKDFPMDPKFWPCKPDGTPISPSEWIYREDVPAFKAGWKRLLARQSHEECISYRVSEGGKLRYFEMRVREAGALTGEKGFLGMIRDVTQARERENSLLETNILMQEILDNSPCGIFVKDINDGGRYLISNNHNLQVHGLEPEAMLGKSDAEIFPAKVAEGFERSDREVLEKEGFLKYLDHFTDSAGRERIFQLYKVVLPQKTDKRLLLGISFDLTEIENNRTELAKNVKLLQSIIENMPCHFFVKDASDDFRILLVNEHFAGYFNKEPEELIGKTELELLPSLAQAEKFFKNDLSLLAAGGRSEFISEITGATGESRVFHTSKSLVTLEDGRKLIQGIAIDITEQEKAKTERRKLIKNLNRYIKQERMLKDSLEAVVMSPSSEEALHLLLQTAVEYIGAVSCYLVQYDFSSARFLPLVKYLHPDFEEESGLQMKWRNSVKPPWYSFYERREPFLAPQAYTLRDLLSASGYEELTHYLNVNEILSLATVGLYQDKKIWGSLTFFFRDNEKKFTALDNRWLKVTAHLVEMVLDSRFRHQQLERSEYEKRLIMDTMDIPIQLFDANMKLIRINSAAQKLVGQSEEKILREPCYRNFCGFETRPNDCPTLLTREDHQKHQKALTLKGNDFEICSHPVFIDGKLAYILKTFVDVSESKKTQQKLTQALLKAQDASRAKSFFLATMSHEIRTPLNAVIGFSELLKKGQCPEEEKLEYLESIHLSANALLSLINDILDLSRIEAGAVSLALRNVSIAELLQEIRSIFQYQAQTKGLEFLVECPDDIPALRVDQLRLRQILLNLVGNAVKFTEHGSVKVSGKFKIKTELLGELRLTVEDSGIGIEESAQKKIFQPFIQQDSIRETFLHKGTGLGLAISHQLAIRMGGSLEVESRVGQGSKFTLSLENVPYQNNGQAPLISAPTRQEEELKIPEDILLVDDVPMNLSVLSLMLKNMGAQPRTATSGAKALEEFENFTPEIILTDIWMPDMDGCQLAKSIRKKRKFKQIRIIAVTADSEVQVNFDLGDFDAVLLKPLTIPKMKSLFRDLKKNNLRKPGIRRTDLNKEG